MQSCMRYCFLSLVNLNSLIFSHNEIEKQATSTQMLRSTYLFLKLFDSLMSYIRSIIAAMRLLKSFWGEILNMVAYPKNRSPSQNRVNHYERANEEKQNLKHLRIIGSQDWVHIPEKLKKKLNDKAGQGIFVGYEGRNLYRIYHPLTNNIHKTREVDIVESLLYNKSEVNSWEFADREWENSDDFLFADPLEFDEEQPKNNETSTSISGRKDVNSPQSGKKGEDVGSMANDSNDNDIGSALTSLPDHIESPPRRSKRNRTEQVIYLGQIVYGSRPLPKVNVKAPEVDQ